MLNTVLEVSGKSKSTQWRAVLTELTIAPTLELQVRPFEKTTHKQVLCLNEEQEHAANQASRYSFWSRQKTQLDFPKRRVN